MSSPLDKSHALGKYREGQAALKKELRRIKWWFQINRQNEGKSKAKRSKTHEKSSTSTEVLEHETKSSTLEYG